MHEIHTFPIFINDDSTVLILGSFPSVKSREQNFYYAHPQNRFFPTLARIFSEDVPHQVQDRKIFLKKHRIALYDVIEECDIDGSDDSSIRNVTPINLKSILEEYPNIQTIGVLGKKAQHLFEQYLKDDCSVKVIYLPSTSPANAKMKLDDLVKEFQVLFK